MCCDGWAVTVAPSLERRDVFVAIGRRFTEEGQQRIQYQAAGATVGHAVVELYKATREWIQDQALMANRLATVNRLNGERSS